MKDKVYNLIILGLGPAGITAGIYAARYKLDTIAIGSQRGGMVSWSHLIDNVPGFGEISGEDLADKFFKHLRKGIFDSEKGGYYKEYFIKRIKLTEEFLNETD